jgi:putative membrane protein
MVGLLYLPRLFVNHANPEISKETSETFKLMEGKLYRIIMFPSFIVTWISGISLIHYVGIDTWLLLKIFFVVLLSGYHFFCLKCLNDFKNDKNKYSTKFFRITNEAPAVILIFILILVVFQPF